MKIIPVLDQQISQAEFAQMIGVSEARVSQLMSEGVIAKGQTAREWLTSYCIRLREVAAGRMSDDEEGLDLVTERAKLARSQRTGQDIKNAIALKQYSPIRLLSQTLALASQAVVEQFEMVPSMLKKMCPELPDSAREVVMQALARARNEWVEKTQKLLTEAMEAQMEGDEEVVEP